MGELTASLQAIAKQEALRRKALYDQAIVLLAPVIDLIRTAREQKADVSLKLDPPLSRGSEACSGVLHCRSFHDGVGTATRDYVITILPGRCQLELRGKLSELPDDDYEDWIREWEYEHRERYAEYDGPEPNVVVWRREYKATDGDPTIAELKQDIEEALITELAEQLGGIEALEI